MPFGILVRSIVLWFSLFVVGGGAAVPLALADAPGCNDQIARGVQAIHRGRVAQLSRCLRSGNYADCNDADSHTVAHENELTRYVAAENSECREALAAGAEMAEFGIESCPAEWKGCDLLVPVIDDPSDLADCLICGLHGHDLFVRDSFGLPGVAPTDSKERRCNLNLARTLGQALRKGFKGVSRCADGQEKPFACFLDTDPRSRFGKAVGRIAKKVGKCRLDEGEAPETLAKVCGGQASEAALTECLQARTRCLVCRSSELAFSQGLDCVAESGDIDCDGSF